jgi:hypothetical protein
MKRTLVLLSCVFYLLFTSGFVIHFHFCGGKLKAISVLPEADEDGCCGGSMKASGCCKDRAVYVKVKDNHQLHVQVIVPASAYADVLPGCIQTVSLNNHNVSTELPEFYYPPPDPPNNSFLTLYSILRV